ncbi:MAG TPA: bifunctional nicotinamidase/pyrazinamidase [Deltaproteobacteria bacterium]|nr:bifunctional nicotinamidase/pyrazinamidase [Deltaproteobacteria bacterium]
MDLKDIRYEQSSVIGVSDALLVVDVQNDFMPSGALPVEQGDTIVTGINALMKLFSDFSASVVLTQDWHPAGHHSFASAHKGKAPYDPYDAPGLGPVLWPDHCVQSTPGADFHPELDTGMAHAAIRKGYHPFIDSYSGFFENDRTTPTGLEGYLHDRGVQRVFVCGLALDYCVFYTALDAIKTGFEVYVVADLTRAVGSPPDGVSTALETLISAGARFVHSPAIRHGA